MIHQEAAGDTRALGSEGIRGPPPAGIAIGSAGEEDSQTGGEDVGVPGEVDPVDTGALTDLGAGLSHERDDEEGAGGLEDLGLVAVELLDARQDRGDVGPALVLDEEEVAEGAKEEVCAASLLVHLDLVPGDGEDLGEAVGYLSDGLACRDHFLTKS
jgi:hypothetical protein